MKTMICVTTDDKANGDVVYQNIEIGKVIIEATIKDDEAFYTEEQVIKMFRVGMEFGNKGYTQSFIARWGEEV